MSQDLRVAPRLVLEEFWNSQVGRLLGEGMTRTVYDFPITNDKYVIKVERIDGKEDRHFQNQKEWALWSELKDTPLAEWLAPCHWISANGLVLIQRKTKIMAREKYPDKVPGFFNDLKFSNFGEFEGRCVCHDYGVINADRLIRYGKRMITAHWWSEDD